MVLPLTGLNLTIVYLVENVVIGVVAQLVERVHGMDEVAGSSPASSTEDQYTCDQPSIAHLPSL